MIDNERNCWRRRKNVEIRQITKSFVSINKQCEGTKIPMVWARHAKI